MEEDENLVEPLFDYHTNMQLVGGFATILLTSIILIILFYNAMTPSAIFLMIVISAVILWMIYIIVRIFRNRILEAEFFEDMFTVSYYHKDKEDYSYADINDVSLHYGPALTSTTLTIFLKSEPDDKLKLIVNPRKKEMDLHSFLLDKIGSKFDDENIGEGTLASSAQEQPIATSVSYYPQVSELKKISARRSRIYLAIGLIVGALLIFVPGALLIWSKASIFDLPFILFSIFITIAEIFLIWNLLRFVRE